MMYLKRLFPTYTPPAIARTGGLMILRERILHGMLLSFLPLGIFLILGAFRDLFLLPFPIIPAVSIAVYILIVILAFLRHAPYNLRGCIILSSVYLIAWSQVLRSDQAGNISAWGSSCQIFLLFFIAMTAVLYKTPHILAAMALSLAPIIVQANIHHETDWIIHSITFFSITAILSGSIELIVNGLNDNLKKHAELSQNLERELDMLDERVKERTLVMARRMAQLRTSAEISRQISALSDPDSLFQQVVNLIKEGFELYYVGIFLLDSTRQNAVLQAGTGEPGRQMLATGHHLAVGGSSMIGWSIANRKARVALDAGAEAVRFNNPNLPLTRSELALPIIAHDTVHGAMTVQSEKENAFDESDISMLQSIADSLAIALENDRLYNETRQRLDEIRALNHEYIQNAWAETTAAFGELSYEYESPAAGAEGRLAVPTAGKEGQPAGAVQVPLMLRDEIIGSINLEMDHDTLTEDETAFIENVTTQTAIALENARLLHETERRAAQEQKLNELASRFSRAFSIEEILQSAVQELGQLPAVAEVSIQINPVSAPAQAKPAVYPPGSFAGGSGKERGV